MYPFEQTLNPSDLIVFTTEIKAALIDRKLILGNGYFSIPEFGMLSSGLRDHLLLLVNQSRLCLKAHVPSA